jgi:predicted DNA-binding transcriptional regulator AlpA
VRLLTFSELRQKLANRSRASIYRDIERGYIPKPLKLGRSVYWEEAQITKHIEKLIEAAND